MTKKRRRKQYVEGCEGKLLENCGKMEKGEKRRRKEERRREGWEAQRAEGLLHDTAKHRWNNACHVPSTFARRATMFEPNRLGKKLKNTGKNKKCKFEQSAYWFVTRNRPKWYLHRPRRPHALNTVLKFAKTITKHSAKNDNLMSKY